MRQGVVARARFVRAGLVRESTVEWEWERKASDRGVGTCRLVDLNFLVGFRCPIFHIPGGVGRFPLREKETMIIMRIVRLPLRDTHGARGIFSRRRVALMVGLALRVMVGIAPSGIVITGWWHATSIGVLTGRRRISVGVQTATRGRRILGQLGKTGQVNVSSPFRLTGWGRAIGVGLAVIGVATRIEAIAGGRFTRITGMIVHGRLAVHGVE